MKVICIRFTSGEEIIAKLEDTQVLTGTPSQFESAGPWEPVGKITIGTVRGITFQPVGPNQVGIAFVPWSVGNVDVKVTIQLENCAVAVYEPSSDLERGYLEQTSGIALGGNSTSRPGIKL